MGFAHFNEAPAKSRGKGWNIGQAADLDHGFNEAPAKSRGKARRRYVGSTHLGRLQ